MRYRCARTTARISHRAIRRRDPAQRRTPSATCTRCSPLRGSRARSSSSASRWAASSRSCMPPRTRKRSPAWCWSSRTIRTNGTNFSDISLLNRLQRIELSAWTTRRSSIICQLREDAARRALPEVPLVVVTAPNATGEWPPDWDAELFDRLRAEQQADLASRVPGGVQVFAEQKRPRRTERAASGHHRRRPDGAGVSCWLTCQSRPARSIVPTTRPPRSSPPRGAKPTFAIGLRATASEPPEAGCRRRP